MLVDGDMTTHAERAGLRVAAPLAAFVETRALPGSGVGPDAFWRGLAALLARFAPENARLLARRDELQAAIDAWHDARRGRAVDRREYQAFLRKIGYLADGPAPFAVGTAGVDPEVASVAGPQLVAPVTNARYLLNAANARWGSLYDALYGTDALGTPPPGGAHDPGRGRRVVARARAFLDGAAPLAAGSWADWTGGRPALADPSQLAGVRGDSLLLRHHGLHVEVAVDRAHPVGRDDPAGVADVVLEAAPTTIVDFEDSVAAVDAEDKVAAYANWLGLMRGDLSATFEKGGRTVTRALAPDREWTAPDGARFSLPGRSLLFVRTVGHLMTTPAVLTPDGREAPEGLVDAAVTCLAALHGLGRNGRAGAIYVVRPKMHGPDECAFADRAFDAVEEVLGLARHTVKLGLMDEERRTSTNLAACVHAVRNRIAFVNTGFLDRTGDEIRTSTRAGPVVRKADMRGAEWFGAYERGNVAVALACGLSGRAQIGKGMWAAPDRMADMLAQKGAQLLAGATTAWVPSPTAATLHALHYHEVDVFARHRALAAEPAPEPDALLAPPLAARPPSADEVARELDNNAQGMLGYVVRWVGRGVGCSKVPDIDDVGLMEDRATLRISSQHMANWLLHGVCTADEVDAAFARMAARVDRQNAGDPGYRPMAGDLAHPAFAAARALVFEGLEQPNGYTEPLLHRYRLAVKRAG